MFAPPSEILKQREGTLADRSLPQLLRAIAALERSCTLELKVRALEKRIAFEDGAPVGCSSNLLHETLGKFLVERQKLTEAAYQECLVQTVQTGARMGEVLVQRQLVAPFDLYKQMQANLAHKILDAFRWHDAKFRVLGPEEVDSPVRVNVAQLILTASATTLPFEVVASELAFVDEQKFAMVPNGPYQAEDLKLSAKDLRLLNACRQQPVFAQLVQRSGFEMEEALRRVYAFCVLGMVDYAEAIQGAAPAPTSAPAAQPAPSAASPAKAPAPAAAPSIPFADEDDAQKNALMAAFLEHRTKDPFDLLGVPVDVAHAPLRKAFVTAADRFSPVRFRSADLRDKAESLLVAYAKAFGALSDPDQLALHKKRRQVAAEAKKPGNRPSTAEQFKIRTDLLDANTQWAEGKARLKQNNPRAAIELFQYAFDIEPKPVFRAYLAWARYLANPEAHAKLALQELADTAKGEPSCEEVHAFSGEIHRMLGDWPHAEEAFRAAFKLNPRERKYSDLANEMSKKKPLPPKR